MLLYIAIVLSVVAYALSS